jgi:hypothetical protein
MVCGVWGVAAVVFGEAAFEVVGGADVVVVGGGETLEDVA